MALLDRFFVMMPDWLLAGAIPMRGAGSTGNGGGSGGNGLPAPGPGTGQGGAAGGGPFDLLLPLLLAFMMLMIFMSVMGGRKQKKQHAAMITGLRKHDKVRMLGGIIGTIAEIHDTEVVIKVDESTNTRIRFAKDAVQSVLKAAPGASSEPEKVE